MAPRGRYRAGLPHDLGGPLVSWLEWMTTGDKLVGLLLGVVAFLAMLGRWFWSRVSTRVSEGVSDLRSGHSDIARRLSDVEEDISGLKNDVGRMRGRIGTIEARLDTLATAKDLAELSVQIARQTGILEQQGTQLTVLYKAAWEASKGRGEG